MPSDNMFLYHKNTTKCLCPSLHEQLDSSEEKYVQYFHSNVVLLLFGIKHFNLVIYSSLSFFLPLHYYYLCFKKRNEKPSKVSAKTPKTSVPAYALIHSANIYWTQTKCQVDCQLLGMRREHNQGFWMLNKGENAEGDMAHQSRQLWCCTGLRLGQEPLQSHTRVSSSPSFAIRWVTSDKLPDLLEFQLTYL